MLKRLCHVTVHGIRHIILAVHCLTCASVMAICNWLARDFTACQHVKRLDMCTYLDMPKSAGLMISYVDGLLRNSLGMDTSFVGESTESGDVVVEWYVNLNCLCYQILNILE